LSAGPRQRSSFRDFQLSRCSLHPASLQPISRFLPATPPRPEELSRCAPLFPDFFRKRPFFFWEICGILARTRRLLLQGGSALCLSPPAHFLPGPPPVVQGRPFHLLGVSYSHSSPFCAPFPLVPITRLSRPSHTECSPLRAPLFFFSTHPSDRCFQADASKSTLLSPSEPVPLSAFF